MKYYHISLADNLTKLMPRIPKNRMTETHKEDNTIPRICISSTIDGCFKAVTDTVREQEVSVYEVETDKAYKPTVEQVPDVEETDEFWLLEETECKFLYKISSNQEIENSWEFIVEGEMAQQIWGEILKDLDEIFGEGEG